MSTRLSPFTSASGHTIDAGGVPTFYLEYGNGAPVVLIHGGGAGADSYGNWRDVIPMLAGKFRVIAVDMLGFGRTGKPAEDFVYSQQVRIDHLSAFLTALDLKEAALVGNSMGGATAIGVAVEHPELVGKLVLMGSAGLVTALHDDLKPVVNYDFTHDGMVRLIRALTTPDFVIDQEMVDYRVALATEPETRRAYAAAMGWIQQQRGLYYAENFIGRVRQPTLVVNGKLDKVVPVANAYRFLELIPQSWGCILPECGHWAMIEHPAVFAEIASRFISG